MLALAALACGGKPKPAGPTPDAQLAPVRPLITTPFSGQSIAVVPLTLLIVDDSTSGVAPLQDHAAALTWADSIIATQVTARGPEVKWVLPADLRKIARRSPTVAPDPDRMGQSVVRGKDLVDTPEPFRTQIRSLMALVGGRYGLVPAALSITREPDGRVRAELALALADARLGRVLWHTVAWGVAPTPARALTVALETAFPVGLGLR